MKPADMLTAAFRQLASAKTSGKSGLTGALHSRDGQDKADHFREQMRQVAKEPSAAIPRAEKNASHATAATTPVLEAAAILAELTGKAKPESTANENLVDKEEDAPTPADDGTQAATTDQDWRDPNATLGAVIAKFDHEQQSNPHSGKLVPHAPAAQVNVKAAEHLSDATSRADAADIDWPAIDQSGTKRFNVIVDTSDPRTTTTVIAKAVVREQETHFEPVQQVTTLQKIVDRMASDLPAVAAPEGAKAAESPSQEAAKPTESRPVRMMTLELDPPNLGSVTIRMRLAGDSVEVHLTADRLETTHLLRQERAALSDAMQSAGYSFDIAAIDQTRMPDGSANNSQSQSQQQPQASFDQRGPTQSSNGPQTDSGSSGRSSGDGQGSARQNRQDHEQSHVSPERKQDHQGGRGVRNSTVYL